MRKLDVRSREISDNIEEAVRALSSQLDSLLDISKLDAGIVPVNVSIFDLKRLLYRVIDEFQSSAETANIRLEPSCPTGALANTDPTLLERIVRNVLTNAITHNRGCTLTVTVLPQRNRWDLKISDTGSGIEYAEQYHIFEEFYQVHNPERDRSKGLGLGLSIVQRLSHLLGTDMTFDSEPGVGTSFTFSIPRSEAAARSKNPDIALADYSLRHNDSGLDIIEQLRKLHPGLPALIITGDTAPERLLKVKNAGIDILSKSVAMKKLRSAIASACNTSPNSPGVD